MPGRAQQRTVEAVRSVGKLRGRREVRVLAFYLGGAWIMYEVPALTADTFGLSQLVVRLTVLVLASGALLAIPMSRWYELTARAVDRGGAALAEIEGVPDVLEPALARAYRRVSRRTAVVAGAGSTLAFTGFFFVLWNAWAEAHAYVAPDSRISIVVFPFRTPGPAADAFGEAIGDLLVVTLDGTPGIRIVDPASVWRSLRPKRGEPARAPEFEDALTLSRRVGAGRFVIGSALPSGSNL